MGWSPCSPLLILTLTGLPTSRGPPSSPFLLVLSPFLILSPVLTTAVPIFLLDHNPQLSSTFSTVSPATFSHCCSVLPSLLKLSVWILFPLKSFFSPPNSYCGWITVSASPTPGSNNHQVLLVFSFISRHSFFSFPLLQPWPSPHPHMQQPS